MAKQSKVEKSKILSEYTTFSPLKDQLTSTEEGVRIWQQERSIFETTELICELMDREVVNKTELALRLNRTKGFVSKLLDGSANMTVRTISDVMTALGYEFVPSVKKMSKTETHVLSLQFPIGLDSFADEDVNCGAGDVWGPVPDFNHPTVLSA